MLKTPLTLKLVLWAIVLVSLLCALQTLMVWMPRQANFRGQDGVSRFEMDLSILKIAISGEAAVGYLGDHSNPLNSHLQRRFQQAQYILAPTMLTEKRPSRYVVSVWYLDQNLQREIEAQGLVLVSDFGNEIRLFERKGR